MLVLQVMLDNEMVLSMLRDVVAGLTFLHAAVPPIRHQGLRSSKVLLDSSCRGHLSDYHQDVVRSPTAHRCPVVITPPRQALLMQVPSV